jgi:hypothetical protein
MLEIQENLLYVVVLLPLLPLLLPLLLLMVSLLLQLLLVSLNSSCCCCYCLVAGLGEAPLSPAAAEQQFVQKIVSWEAELVTMLQDAVSDGCVWVMDSK